jgi:hypothetical protein
MTRRREIGEQWRPDPAKLRREREEGQLSDLLRSWFASNEGVKAAFLARIAFQMPLEAPPRASDELDGLRHLSAASTLLAELYVLLARACPMCGRRCRIGRSGHEVAHMECTHCGFDPGKRLLAKVKV